MFRDFVMLTESVLPDLGNGVLMVDQQLSWYDVTRPETTGHITQTQGVTTLGLLIANDKDKASWQQMIKR